MKKYVIHGGRPLYGKVEISGAKNAAVGIIPAALLVEGPCRIENIPAISDVDLLLNILRDLGAKVRMINRTTVEVDCTGARRQSVPYEAAVTSAAGPSISTSRASRPWGPRSRWRRAICAPPPRAGG